MKKIRYAVVGAGWISQEAFMPAIKATGNSEMSVIVSGSEEAARKLATFHNVPHVVSYDGYDEMLSNDMCDAVYIALPNSLHAEYAIHAAKAGKHVLVEKPLAITEEECRAMMAAAEEAGVYLMTAYRLHNEPGTLDVIARIKAGEIGDPRIFSSTFSLNAEPGNHRLKATHWGGALQDVGVYCLNAMRHVFAAEPEEVLAMASDGGGDPRFAEVPETVAATLKFPGGKIGQFIASFGADDMDCYSVSGTKGSLLLNPGFRFDLTMELEIRKQLERSRVTYAHPDHFSGQIGYLSECILTGTPLRLDGADGLADVVIMRAIERSIETRAPVKISGLGPIAQPEPDMERNFPQTDHRLLL
ncbi:Gfo/Idh/MocA family protein [Celeribacter sp.]|uniref:Gfo/Idh/MocA family protein n=1 Tax=Celeribacter sp. TaxID=1890673 RepID=UPI003A8CA5BA